MKEIKTSNYIKKQAQGLPVGDPGLPGGDRQRDYEQNETDITDTNEFYYTTKNKWSEPAEITIWAPNFNRWNKSQSIGGHIPPAEILPGDEITFKVDFEFTYDTLDRNYLSKKVLGVTNYDGTIDYSLVENMIDTFQGYEPFYKQLQKFMDEIIDSEIG